MPLLYPNFRITQIFGANTDVGKTLLATALLRATSKLYASDSSSSTAATGPAKDGRKRVFYLKPVSTGPGDESDVEFVYRHTKDHAGLISAKNLYQYREPMSPHLAAQLAPDLPFPQSNDILVRAVQESIEASHASLQGQRGALYVETAGGVHSPALHPPHTQSTFLRSLLLPSVLIASPHLGGISTTLTSFESLHLRGYSIPAVLCLYHPYYRNHEFLGEYFGERGIPFYTISPPPEKNGTVQEDAVRLAEWYRQVEGSGHSEVGGGVGDTAKWLDQEHGERIAKLESMPERTLDNVWWPFTQHGLVNKKQDVMVVDSAMGDNFDAFYTKAGSTSATSNDPAESLLKPYFDGSASWFTQSHGHASEHLTLAAAHAAGRYGHVLFPSGTHEPALHLAEKLKDTVGKGWADRVFYSDNGSTGMEVALKMALRAAGRRYGWDGEAGAEVGVIGLKGGYHGDTIGSMDATEASTYNTAVDWYRGRGFWFSPPSVQFVNGKPSIHTLPPDPWPTLPSTIQDAASTPEEGWSVSFPSLSSIYDLRTRLTSPMAEYYRKYIRSTLKRLTREEGRKFGALVMEPTCLGAGGMIFVDPLFQACLIEVVRSSGDLFGAQGASYETDIKVIGQREGSEWRGLPVIYDEVFSGLHRFGYNSAATVLHHTPDIAAYAKILTGGLLPLSTTLASKSIFEAFLSDRKVDALLHGHSYTANPIGCAVALEAMDMIDRHKAKGGWGAERAMWGIASPSTPSGEVEEDTARWSFWSQEFVRQISEYPGVSGAMAMGTVLAVELADADGGYSSHTALNFLTTLRQEAIAAPNNEFAPFQIHSRPLGNVVYIMTSLFTKPAVMRAMEAVLLRKAGELK